MKHGVSIDKAIVGGFDRLGAEVVAAQTGCAAEYIAERAAELRASGAWKHYEDEFAAAMRARVAAGLIPLEYVANAHPELNIKGAA